VLGAQLEGPSFLHFFGVALVAFSIRRIADQRQERDKRLAAEHYDPLTQLPNRRKFQDELGAALKRPKM
jgi:GGDEF domain-containing protein